MTSVPLPVEGVRLVSGSGGRTLWLLQEFTGCELSLSQTSDGSVTVEAASYCQASRDLAGSLVRSVARGDLSHECLADLSSRCWRDSPDHLVTVSSNLCDIRYTTVAGARKGCKTWCPICKRPLDITTSALPCGSGHAVDETLPFNSVEQPVATKAGEPPVYAYVAAIWGTNPGFVLGALVLGKSLARTSSGNIDRVLLHTADIGGVAKECLGDVWSLQLVEDVEVCDRCFLHGKTGRFAGTFNKLHALKLTRYRKVLLLDIDLLVREDLAGLFSLRPPAALGRGHHRLCQGARLDGRTFFNGADGVDANGENRKAYAWSQGTGINAGVVLLEPNERVYQTVIDELKQELHPAHIPTCAPEQDYISRFLAPYWTHIDVRYNFQIHQLLYSMEWTLQRWPKNRLDEWLPARLSLPPAEVAVVHFSGPLKLWERAHDGDGHPFETDSEFADKLLREMSPWGYHLWVAREGKDEDYARYNVAPGEDEDGRRILKPLGGGDGQAVEDFVRRVATRALEICTIAVTEWTRQAASLGGSLAGLREKLGRAVAPMKSRFWPGQSVVVCWEGEGGEVQSSPAIVDTVYEDCTMDLWCDYGGGRGVLWRGTQPGDVSVRQCA